MRFSNTNLLLSLFAAMATAQEGGLERVVVSYQTELSAVAHSIALDKGYYSHLGLDVQMKWYPSGAPQVKDAVEQAAWDFGGAGVVPNILGGPQGILGVGISMDQSATNQLVGNAAGVAAWAESISDLTIVVSPNSTGDYVVQACLKSQGFNIKDATFLYEQQAGCIEAMANGSDGTPPRANLGGLWAPNTYSFLDAVTGAENICSGASVYATVTGGHMVRKEFAEENPSAVAKILSGWLRAVNFINNDDNKNEVLDYMSAFFAAKNVTIPRSSLELDLRLVGLFGLEQQLDLMERRGNPPLSNYDIWTNEVGSFMLDNGVIAQLTNPTTYIDDQYMKMVNANPQLRDWAKGLDPSSASDASGADNWTFTTAMASTLVLGTAASFF